MTQSPVLEPVGRLDRLEQETNHLASLLKTANRQITVLQLALILVTAGVVGGAYYLITTGKLKIDGLSPPVARTVESTEFGLYNRFGTRVMFDTDDRFGQPRVTFLDDKKRLKMRLLVFPDGDGTGGVALYDHTGWRGMFRMDADMGSSVRLKGEGQKGGIDMTVDRDGNPTLKLTDKTGKVLWEAPPKSK